MMFLNLIGLQIPLLLDIRRHFGRSMGFDDTHSSVDKTGL